MSSEKAIVIDNISKIHRIYDKPSDRLLELFQRRSRHKVVTSLKDVSFTVDKGSTVGIIGRNGAGKSTLLQIVAGTQRATSGRVQVVGRVAALLELGAGFNMDFSGKENVFLYGSILGLSRDEVRARYNKILDFAEIGEFINYPVKTYSSGMFVRLAFSVAINVDPDILIVDEALSVGDLQFQHKCIAKLKELQRNGCTILFVSHDIDSVKSLCSSAILLNKGEVCSSGTPESVAKDYMELIHTEQLEKHKSVTGSSVSKYEVGAEGLNWSPEPFAFSERHGNGLARFVRVILMDKGGSEVDRINFGEPLQITMMIEYSQVVATEINVGIMMRDDKGIDILGDDSWNHGLLLPQGQAGSRFLLHFSFPNMWIKPGSYSVTVALGAVSPDHLTWNDFYYDWIERAHVFTVSSSQEVRVWSKVLLPSEIRIS